MKIVSDKSIKIFNNINIFHNFENNFIEKIAIDLSLHYSNKKIFWIFNDKKIPSENYINYIIANTKDLNFVNILFLEKNLDKKKKKLFFALMKNYGKKIVVITDLIKKNPTDQSIFYCKFNKSISIVKKNIIKVLENI